METKTITIDNFKGSMVPSINGDMNSGNSYWLDVNGYDPFTKPGNLTWNEIPVQVDPTGLVITDCVMAGKVRVEVGIVYVYCIGHTGRVYKIQVNDPTTYNPDYDNPVLLTTLTLGTPTFTRGAFIDFFGTTERILISHDKGVTQLNFDGTGETVMGVVGSWTQNVPKPLQQFLGKMYIGNGNNLAEIDTTNTVTSYVKLSPSFPPGTQVRDLKLTVDGNYLQAVVTRAALPDITSVNTDTSVLVPTDSFVFSWNGTDIGYTSSQNYPAIILTSSAFFSDSSYLYGYDSFSSSAYNPVRKIFTSLPDVVCSSPFPNAIFSIGNLIYWFCNIGFGGKLWGIMQAYGSISDQVENGFWCPVLQEATLPETDILQMPFFLPVSNMVVGSSSSNYPNAVVGTPKAYYSTIETSSAPTVKYKFFKWQIIPNNSGPAYPGVFQTQNQLFSKKIQVKQVRIYAQPWVTNNEFTVDLIGSNDNPIANCSKTFTAGTNLTVGEDFAWYDPSGEPVYSLALRITNSGSANFIINKVEIDYTSGGK